MLSTESRLANDIETLESKMIEAYQKWQAALSPKSGTPRSMIQQYELDYMMARKAYGDAVCQAYCYSHAYESE